MSLEEQENLKRPRVESVNLKPNSPDSKRVRYEQDDSITLQPESPRVNDHTAKFERPFDQIRDDLLGILSDSDELDDRDTAIPELDSVIKSLQDELTQPPEKMLAPATQPELGYLLEASDDELGLPPVTTSPPAGGSGAGELPVISPEGAGILGQMIGFEDEFPSYEFGRVVEEETLSLSGEFVVDGLFCYDEREPSDQSELPWKRRVAADPTVLTG